MQFGVVLPGGPPHVQLELAVEAERAGWNGVFVWEAAYGVDAWCLLSAMAMRTTTVRLGSMLTPLPWRRPWIAPWAEAGATWWLESRWGGATPKVEEMRRRIAGGPPAPP